MEIPFVSLRHGMADEILHGQSSFAEAVDAVSSSLAPAELTIDLRRSSIDVAGKNICLTPASLALLSTFARRRILENEPLRAPVKEVPDVKWAERYLKEYLPNEDGGSK